MARITLHNLRQRNSGTYESPVADLVQRGIEGLVTCEVTGFTQAGSTLTMVVEDSNDQVAWAQRCVFVAIDNNGEAARCQVDTRSLRQYVRARIDVVGRVTLQVYADTVV